MRALMRIVEASGHLNFIDPDDLPGKSLAKPVGKLNSFIVALTTDESNYNPRYFIMDGDRAIAALILRGVSDGPFAKPTLYSADYAVVTPSQRGSGLMRRLYVWLLDQGMVLVSGGEQSKDAEAMWTWLQTQARMTAIPADAVNLDQEQEVAGDHGRWLQVARKA